MKTYAETKNKKPFDWLKFLKKKAHTYQEWDKAKILAGGWVTCACGNQCSIIPRYPDGHIRNDEPIDQKLKELGMDFYGCVEMEDNDRAIKVLKKIEKRSSEIITSIRKNKKKTNL